MDQAVTVNHQWGFFFFIQQHQAEKTEPVWTSQESENCSFCIKILSHTITNHAIYSGLKNSLHPKFAYNLRAFGNSPRLSNESSYTSINFFSSTKWHGHQVTPVSLGCDAQVDNVLPCSPVDEVIIRLLLLAMQKLCTANTCGIGKQETEGSRAHEKKK